MYCIGIIEPSEGRFHRDRANPITTFKLLQIAKEVQRLHKENRGLRSKNKELLKENMASKIMHSYALEDIKKKDEEIKRLISKESSLKREVERLKETIRLMENTRCEIYTENKKSKGKLEIQKDAVERFVLCFEDYIKEKIHIEEQNGKIVARFRKNGERLGAIIIDWE